MLTNYCYRDVIVWVTSNTLMLTSQISLVVLKPLKIVCACMKRIMEFCGSIKTGGRDWQKLEDLGGSLCPLSVLSLIMSMDSSGTSIRQVKDIPFSFGLVLTKSHNISLIAFSNRI